MIQQPPAVLVDLAIACCPVCMSNFNLDEWRELDLTEEQPEPPLERRACSECSDGAISLLLEGLDDLELRWPLGDYVAAFGRDGRASAAMARAAYLAAVGAADVRKRENLRRAALALTLCLMLCLTILAAAYLLSR